MNVKKKENDLSFGIDSRSIVLIMVVFSLVVRLTIGMGYSNSYDTEWNIKWAVELSDGFFNAYEHLTSLDYPPLYLYPLYLVGKLIKLDAVGGYQPFRMLAIKLFPCLADSLTSVVLYRIGKRHSVEMGLFAAGIWAINPAAIFNCGFWGQTDCVMIFMTAVLFMLIGEKKIIASGIMFALLCSTKLQGVYLTPVVGMELLVICFGRLEGAGLILRLKEKRRWLTFGRFFASMLLTLAAVYLPFIIGSRGLKPLGVYLSGVDTYQYCTFNADNIYRLMNLNGVSDSLEILPGITYSFVGNVMLVLAVVWTALFYIIGIRRSHWLAAYMLIEFIFMLTCRQHERYQILTLIMLIGAFIQTADKRVFTLFWMHVLVVFSNEARVLGVVHEKGAWWTHYGYNLSMINSALNFILFVVSTVYVFRYFFDRNNERRVSDILREYLTKALSNSQDAEEAE